MNLVKLTPFRCQISQWSNMPRRQGEKKEKQNSPTIYKKPQILLVKLGEKILPKFTSFYHFNLFKKLRT